MREEWVHRYSGQGNAPDFAHALVVDGNGDVVVTGSTATGFELATAYNDHDVLVSDYYTAKYSGTSGVLIWERRYNSLVIGDDIARAVAVDGNGNVFVTGGSSRNFYTAKYAAADGALLWERRVINTLGPANAIVVDGSGDVMVAGTYMAKYRGSDGALLWEPRPGNAVNALALALDANGNVVVAGSSLGDFYTAKHAALDGTLLWEMRYNWVANTPNTAKAVAVDQDGNVLVTGWAGSSGHEWFGEYTYSYYDYYTAKYAGEDGALLWEMSYNGPADGDDRAEALALDGTGNVAVTGTSMGVEGRSYYTVKYAAADGALLWENRYHGFTNLNQFVRDVSVDNSGNVVVTGSTGRGFESYPLYPPAARDIYTAKYAAADGALLWEIRHNGLADAQDEAEAVSLDQSGNVIVTGGSDGDFYTAKYTADGSALLWEHHHKERIAALSSGVAAAVDGDGNIVVTGYSMTKIDYRGSISSKDYYTAKYEPRTGALLWEQSYNGTGNGDDHVEAVALDADGNVVVTGSSWNGTNNDYCTIKYAAGDGALLWEKRYNGTGNNNDIVHAIAVDHRGDVVVTGSSFAGWDSLFDHYTAKYAGEDGALLWEIRYNGPANGDDQAQALALDANDNVIVTGLSGSRVQANDHYTAKYAASDGALIWEQRGSNGQTKAVAVDSSGNVVITGFSSSDWNYDYFTAKYAAADGALLWENRYDGPANDDFATAVAVDHSGNAVVTGASYNGNNLDYYTAKYAAASGALLWEKRYDGPANDDFATAMAVDHSGNVVVTGSSNGSNGYPDYYTAKYAAADGALIWEMRYDGQARRRDLAGNFWPDDDDYAQATPHCLALGPHGMVVVTGSSVGDDTQRRWPDFTTVVYREVPPPIVPPIVTISAHAPNVPIANSSITLHGTATDLDGVAEVLFQVGDGPFRPATGTTNWSAVLMVQPGINSIRVKAIDTVGTESEPASSIVYFLVSPLTLATNGTGKVTSLTNGQPLVLGKRYTLKATPGPRHLFSHWTGTISSASPTLVFTAVPDTTFTAHFLTNQFPSWKGQYIGLLSDPLNPSHENGGSFAFTLSGGGAFSGRLTLAGKSHPFSGRFTPAGHAHRTIRQTAPKPAIEINLQLGTGANAVRGTVSAGSVASELTSYRAAFSSANPATSFKGRYTLLLSGSTNPAVSPFGHGYATLTVAPNGRATLTGTLADNTPFAQSSPLSSHGVMPLYNSLQGGGGSSFGWLTLLETSTNDIHGSLLWTKPTGRNGPFYPSGFMEEVNLLGSRYVATNRPLLNFSHTKAIFEGGNLASPLTNDIALCAQNRLNVTPPNPDELKLFLSPATGRFTGRFDNPATRKRSPVKGVLLQKQNAGSGFFLGTNQSGLISLGSLENYPFTGPR